MIGRWWSKLWMERPVTTWLRHTAQAALVLFDPVIGYGASLIRFWGPRLGDRVFVSSLLLNAAFLAGIHLSEARLNTLTLIIWAGANLLAPVWDRLPNERLSRPAPHPQAGSARGPGVEFDVPEDARGPY